MTKIKSFNSVEQAHQCFKNIEKALLEAGSSLDQVVRVHYIFPNKSDFEPCWPIFKKYLGKACPAATMFVAGLLDDLLQREPSVRVDVGDGAVFGDIGAVLRPDRICQR